MFTEFLDELFFRETKRLNSHLKWMLKAGRKKGISADEKRLRMLDLFYESKEFFQMKELERIAPKQKGVISQAVKEVTQLLVDEGLVECEKIGTFICYWAFPTKAAIYRKRKLDEVTKGIATLESKLSEADDELKEAKIGREESDERLLLLQENAKLKAEEAELQQKLAALDKFGPEALEEVRTRTKKAKNDANRWTDNIFAVQQWCKKKFTMDVKLLNKQFEIPEELDYVE